jgi:hypothetical protein
MKYLVAVKLPRVTKIFEFKRLKDAKAFIKDIEGAFKNVEWAITKAVV